jgi:hypothetical protein
MQYEFLQELAAFLWYDTGLTGNEEMDTHIQGADLMSFLTKSKDWYPES